MPGIEDLTNIMMAGGRPDVPMPAPPQGAPMPPQAGPLMGGPPPQAGPMGPPPQAGPMPSPQGAPEMMAEAAPDIEQDSAALAEAVVGRAGGDIQMAVVILDTAKAMLVQNAEQSPQMMQGGGAVGRNMMNPRAAGAAAMIRNAPRGRGRFGTALEQQELQKASTMSMPGPYSETYPVSVPKGGKDGGYLYAAEGEPIDDTEVLKQMIMEGLSQEGRTLSDLEMFGRAGSDRDEINEMRNAINQLDPTLGPVLSDRDRTISDRISEEEVRNEIRMLEREEPSSQRDMTYDEALEYLQQLRQPSR